jgi:hypothetical protein
MWTYPLLARPGRVQGAPSHGRLVPLDEVLLLPPAVFGEFVVRLPVPDSQWFRQCSDWFRRLPWRLLQGFRCSSRWLSRFQRSHTSGKMLFQFGFGVVPGGSGFCCGFRGGSFGAGRCWIWFQCATSSVENLFLLFIFFNHACWWGFSLCWPKENFASSLSFPGWVRSGPFWREPAFLSTKWLWDLFSSLPNGMAIDPGHFMAYKMVVPVNCLGSLESTTISIFFIQQWSNRRIHALIEIVLKEQSHFVEFTPPQEHSSNCLFPAAIL